MNTLGQKKHSIDILFPLALVFVFAASAFVVLIFAANIYSRQNNDAQANFSSCTVLSYINERIRRSDANDSISIENIDGINCIAISDEEYVTYIYQKDNNLMELSIINDIDANLNVGDVIIQDTDIRFNQYDDGLIRLEATDVNNRIYTLFISERSNK